MRVPLYRRLSPLVVYCKTFEILTTLRTSWLPYVTCGYAYIDDEAFLTEYALKIVISMLDCSNIDLSQQASELEEIVLYGLLVASFLSMDGFSSLLISLKS